jgi:hypothetical protein
MLNNISKIRGAAIILIADGYGWAGGHYIPANSGLLEYLFQFIVIGVLLALAVKFFSMTEAERLKRNGTITGLNIFSAFSLVINILNIVHGAFNKNAQSFGSHNTFADLVPIVILLIGSGLWVVAWSLVKRVRN